MQNLGKTLEINAKNLGKSQENIRMYRKLGSSFGRLATAYAADGDDDDDDQHFFQLILKLGSATPKL